MAIKILADIIFPIIGGPFLLDSKVIKNGSPVW